MQSEEKKETDIDLTDAIEMRNDQILVKRAEVLHVTKGGIVLPTTGERQAQPLGEVLKVGPGRPLPQGGYAPLGLEPGDRVIYQKASGKAVDTTLLPAIFTLRDHEVIAKISKELFEKLTAGHTQTLTEPAALASPSLVTAPSGMVV